MENLNQLLFQYLAFSLAGGVGVCAAAMTVVYKIVKRKKPTHVNVNCWFCNQNSVVPYGNRNCWDCPNCDQYNGFQENGDYNKPIPAQYMENLNHVASGVLTVSGSKPQQWVNSQLLLCKKCNNYQTLKVKQLASFVPRDEEKYDEEIEVYKHHLEQTYKLCLPCRTAVEYYIKYQNRQLRAVLFTHQLKRREADKTCVQTSYSSSISTPARVVFLRLVAFLVCLFLVVLAIYGSRDPFSSVAIEDHVTGENTRSSVGNASNGETAFREKGTNQNISDWTDLFTLLPEGTFDNMKAAWQYGQSNQIAVVSVGFLTCLLAVFWGGWIRLRRIDAVASALWLLVIACHLIENYLKSDLPDWLETLKFSTTSLCCLVGFTAAVATRKSTGQRRYRARRYLSGDSSKVLYNSNGSIRYPCSATSPSLFMSLPPIMPQLKKQFHRSARRTSPSSLPGRLNRALSLGTIPTLSRTDSGYLFSGSRPPSITSQCKDSPPSDYFSLISGSCPSSPLPSPSPSIAGSVTSSLNSLRCRRPLISPARLNLNGQKLFTSQSDMFYMPSGSDDSSTGCTSKVCTPELPRFPSQSPDVRSVIERGSFRSQISLKKESSSSSSGCFVDTTTNYIDNKTTWTAIFKNSVIQGLLTLSLTINAVFTSIYLYQSLR
ncbi:transmembrane protein 201 [Protopterus annectens]|uniref:transmembrane protein 201 n=1 Tax=Protopterus annectens TaxID=7888 RepID=UPI001CFC15D0|nr:transmembrane protein 201 [Protopterus annectens]